MSLDFHSIHTMGNYYAYLTKKHTYVYLHIQSSKCIHMSKAFQNQDGINKYYFVLI